MLKIKDDVDLRELYNYKFNRFMYYSQNGHYYGKGRVHIDEKTRIIEIPTQQNRYELEAYISDLIEAGLVEKVEDK